MMINDMTTWIKAAGLLSVFLLSPTVHAMDNIEADSNELKRIPPPPPGAYQSMALLEEARQAMRDSYLAAQAARTPEPVMNQPMNMPPPASFGHPMSRPTPPAPPAPMYAPPGYDPERETQEMMAAMQREYRALQREAMRMQQQLSSPAYSMPRQSIPNPQGPSQWQMPAPPAWTQSPPSAPVWSGARPAMPAPPPHAMMPPPTWAQGAQPMPPAQMQVPPPWVIEMQRQMHQRNMPYPPQPMAPWGQQTYPMPNG